MDLGSVEPQLGIAFAHCEHRLVAFEAVPLEAQPLGELLDFAAKDELKVFFTQVTFALRTVNRLVVSVFHQLENELTLALRALKDFRQQDGSRIGPGESEYQS